MLDQHKLVTRSGTGGATWVVLEYWWEGVQSASRPLSIFCDDTRSPVRNKEKAVELLKHRIVEIQNNPDEILGAINRELRVARTRRGDLPDSATLRLTQAQLRAVARYSGLNVPGDVTDAKLFGVPVQTVAEPQDFYLSYG